jgi:hypothetical protein
MPAMIVIARSPAHEPIEAADQPGAERQKDAHDHEHEEIHATPPDAFSTQPTAATH